jgi:transcriptional regulator with XRE-family HTH domain
MVKQREILNIKALAKERGISLSLLGKKLGIHRSNMSAIASANRGVSLSVLRQMADLLDCSLDELTAGSKAPAVFRNKAATLRIQEIQNKNFNGMDKTWVNHVMLAHIRHYGAARRVR